MKLLPETIAFVVLNIFDAVYTALGVQHQWVAEGNPFMLWVIKIWGVWGLVVFKTLWVVAILAIIEYLYRSIPRWRSKEDVPKVQLRIRILLITGIVMYILWWLFGGWLLCHYSPYFVAEL